MGIGVEDKGDDVEIAKPKTEEGNVPTESQIKGYDYKNEKWRGLRVDANGKIVCVL